MSDVTVSTDHVRCYPCGEVLHILFMGHHVLTCPPRHSPGQSPSDGNA